MLNMIAIEKCLHYNKGIPKNKKYPQNLSLEALRRLRNGNPVHDLSFYIRLLNPGFPCQCK